MPVPQITTPIESPQTTTKTAADQIPGWVKGATILTFGLMVLGGVFEIANARQFTPKERATIDAVRGFAAKSSLLLSVKPETIFTRSNGEGLANDRAILQSVKNICQSSNLEAGVVIELMHYQQGRSELAVDVNQARAYSFYLGTVAYCPERAK